MSEILDWLVASAASLGWVAYACIGVILLFESIPFLGFFTPGVLALLGAGFLGAESLFSLPMAWLVASLGALAGDSLAFFYGRRLKGLFRSDNRLLKIEYLAKAEAFFKRFGTAGIYFGRFFGPMRPLISLTAGAARMNPWRFFAAATAGSFSFTALYLGLGYTAGSAWQTVQQWSTRAAVVVAAAIGAFIFLWWLKWLLLTQGKQLGEIISAVSRSLYSSFKISPWFMYLRHRHPRRARFLARRLNPMLWSGLPLSALLAAMLTAVFLFIIAGLSIQNEGFLGQLDDRFHSGLALFRQADLAVGAAWVTILGSPGIIFSLMVGLIVWLAVRRRLSYIMGAWATVLSTFVFVWGGKFLFARPRPDPIFFVENFHSYPSSHAALAAAFCGFLGYYLARDYPRWSRKINALFILTVAGLLVAASRVYLGVHYIGDIVGAWLLAGIGLGFGVIVQRFFAHLDRPRNLTPLKRLFLAGAVFPVCAIMYLGAAMAYQPIDPTYGPLPVQSGRLFPLDAAFKDGHLAKTTENLRGGRKRPLSFVFYTPTEESLRRALLETGWIATDEPTLASLMAKARSQFFAQPYIASPVRPRFWNNAPNTAAFVKPLSEEGRAGAVYELRIWPAPLRAPAGLTAFAAEIMRNQDITLSLERAPLDLTAVKLEMLEALSADPRLSGFETLGLFDEAERRSERFEDPGAETLFVFILE